MQDLIDRGVLSAKAVYRVIPERTFKRRLANREALKVAEGDAIARLLRVTGTPHRPSAKPILRAGGSILPES